jgi:alginate O-acetyltransferase complex protein AlgI
MLFNSFEFLLLFLPVTLLGFFLIARLGKTAAAAWLFACSLFFYGWWDWKYIWLLLGSIAFHFIVGQQLMKLANDQKKAKALLISAIVIDLALLVYYKYADMFIGSFNAATGSNVELLKILLPLGISFFTFTQIAYLVDTYEGKVKETRPIHFGLFVTYFPHLIAGPVLHHKEMMPQFGNDRTYRPQSRLIALGVGIFIIGLAKKVLLADNLAVYANEYFASPVGVGLFQSWQGVLAYSFQLYFDFSGYSDMAVGLSLMFGIKLPINFYSPYKATNISDFWRRWHMTLSRFLRDYLYIRLGGNRHGKARRYLNLMTTMFLGGLWHGAGWNFAIWGTMHGLYLCVHEAWKAAVGQRFQNSKVYCVLAVIITFLATIFAWVPFRAPDLQSTVAIWGAMFGSNGVSLPEVFFSRLEMLTGLFDTLGITQAIGGGKNFVFGYLWIVLAALIAFFAPNTYEIYRRFKPAIYDNATTTLLNKSTKIIARFNVKTAICLALLLVASLLYLGRPSAFLYFQF